MTTVVTLDTVRVGQRLRRTSAGGGSLNLVPVGGEVEVLGVENEGQILRVKNVDTGQETRLYPHRFEVIEDRPRTIQPGDWFSWGTKVGWFRVATVEGDRVTCDKKVTDNRMTDDNSRRRISELADLEFHAPDSPDLYGMVRDLINPPDPRDEEITTLRAKVEELTSRIDENFSRHRRDIDLIGERFSQEAVERDWCEEAERIINGLNENLHIELMLPCREKEHRVRVNGYLRVPFSYTVELTTAETDEDNLIQQANEEVGDVSISRLRECADWYNAEISDDEFDSEVL